MYKVISWDTGEVLQEHENVNKAKRECRKLGCILDHGKYLPVAFVSDGQKVFGRYCVFYNPRFKNPTPDQVKERQ
jgi:hypothetical protein